MGSVSIVRASAGSGKTYRLAYEYIAHVIANPWLYRNILAVTFTNKATEEMKQRIMGELNALASGTESSYLPQLEEELELTPNLIRRRATEVRTKILHDYSHFCVVTIDKFFQRIIRSFLKELGIDANFTLELQTDSILDSATDRMIEEMAVNEPLREWITRFAEEKIEDNKRWDIREDIRKLGAEIFKERYKSLTAGSLPKEELSRVLGEAIGRSRAVTNTMQRIGREALNLIAASGLTIDDFAYGRSGCISYFVKTSEGIVSAYGQRVSDALGSDEKWYGKKSPRIDDIRALIPQLRPRLEELCRLYDDNIRFLNTTALLRENFRSYALLADLSQRIDTLCREQGILPISETNGLLHKLISGNDTPFIYEKAGNAFSHFMIDEFQDTSQQQWSNFVPLLENAVAQDDKSPVLLVGDVKQSIYRWRGGDWQILGGEVNRRFREVADQTLEVNYRSAGTVVRFNNDAIGACVALDNKRLNSQLEPAREQGSLSAGIRAELTDMLANAYEQHRQQSAKAPENGYIRITQFAREFKEEEADKPPVIATVEELQQRGYSPSDIAILVRYNRDGVKIAKQLLDYKTAHPESPYCYDLVTQEALTIGNAPVASFIVAALKLSSNPEDPIRRALYNQFLGLPLNAPLNDGERDFLQGLRLKGVEEALEELILRYRLHTRTEDIAYIQAIQEQVHTFSASKIADLPLFVKWWEETGRTQSINLPQNSRAITIISIHKSKGLQYKAVIVPYCTWELSPKRGSLLWAAADEAPFDALGEMPIRYKNEMGVSYFSEAFYRETVLAHIDNINMFYVAATRAEEELHLMLHSGRQTDTIGGLIAATFEHSTDDTVRIGELEGLSTTFDGGERYEFGQPYRKAVPPVAPAGVPIYPIRRPDTKLKFKFASQRYFDEGEEIQLAPRNYGILMHKVFENIEHEGQIAEQLDLLRANGILSDEERQHLRDTIADAFADPLIRSWFAPKWETVRNEADIIVPRESAVRRPDRVLTKGTEAVVVDYKFGAVQRKSHAVQIREYMDLLRRMGYRTVRGYLWYVELQQVETV